MTVAIELTEMMPSLLENLERGDDVRFLKNGETVAKLTPATDSNDGSTRPMTPGQTALALAALVRADERSKRLGLTFDLEQFKADRDFGRR